MTMIKKFNCEIDCAACAEKVTDAIRKIDGVEDVSVNFLTQKFKLKADNDRFDEILEEAIATGKRIEPDFSVER